MSLDESLILSNYSVQLNPGDKSLLNAIVTNHSQQPDEFALRFSDIDPDWVTCQPASLNLAPGNQATFAIVIQPPPGVPAGQLLPIVQLIAGKSNLAISEASFSLQLGNLPVASQTQPSPLPPVYPAQVIPSAAATKPPAKAGKTGLFLIV